MGPWVWVDTFVLERDEIESPPWMRVAYRDGQKALVLFVLCPFHWPVRFWYYLGGRHMFWWTVYKLGALEVEQNCVLSSGKWRWPWVTKLMVDHLNHGHKAEMAYHINVAQRSAWNLGFKEGFADGVEYIQNQTVLEEVGRKCSPN